MIKTTIIDLNTNKEYDITELNNYFKDSFENNLILGHNIKYYIEITNE